MGAEIHPFLTEPDLIVLGNLFEDVQQGVKGRTEEKPAPEVIEAKAAELEPITHDHDRAAIDRLKAFNNAQSPDFVPTVFTSWDDKDLPDVVNHYIVRPYVRVAVRIVRHPTDVVFLTHLLIYLFVNIPSAVYLFYHFTYLHGVLHSVYTLWCAGSFTLMMHNHIHNNGVLKKSWAWLDRSFPYVLEPLMGHTWDSYYYHHVKHHHVEGNGNIRPHSHHRLGLTNNTGPDDLSTTIRYQRDDLLNFLHYVGRFLLLIWIELPLYFWRKNKPDLAWRVLVSELGSYALLYYMTMHVNARASTFVFLIPFVQLRLGLMIGNWGQHALVDEIEPDSDFRSSITLIDVPVRLPPPFTPSFPY